MNLFRKTGKYPPYSQSIRIDPTIKPPAVTLYRYVADAWAYIKSDPEKKKVWGQELSVVATDPKHAVERMVAAVYRCVPEISHMAVIEAARPEELSEEQKKHYDGFGIPLSEKGYYS